MGQRPPAPVPPATETEPAPRAKTGIERRRLPRVRVHSVLSGYGVETNAKVEVREISLGGFSVESPFEFAPGSEHTFLFATADDRETMVRCECRHSKTTEISGASTCIAGFQFHPNQEESLRIIVELYQRLRRTRSSK